VTLASDGRLTVASEDLTVKWWLVMQDGQWDTGYGNWSADVAPVTALAGRPAGERLVGLEAEGLAHAWTGNGVPVAELAGSGAARAVAITQDGELAAVAAGDAGPRTWDLELDSASDPLPGQITTTRALAFVLGQHRLVVAGETAGEARVELRDEQDPSVVAEEWQWGVAEAGGVRAVAVSQDGGSIVAVGDGFLARLDAESPGSEEPAELLDLGAENVVAVAWLTGDAELVTLSQGGRLRVWRADPAESLGELLVESATGLAVHAAGEFALTTGDDGFMRSIGCE
jgi:WD40 repeat protein